jgi:hypothetical protein
VWPADVIDQGGKNVPTKPANFSADLCAFGSVAAGHKRLRSRIAAQLSHLT